jgi:quercetin dioxygenase-like cupin family protein
MIFFTEADARPLHEDGMMPPPRIDPSVSAELDLSPIGAGSEVKVLFKGDGPEGFSLVHARYKTGFRLPRHSHSADCLYYVLAGEARMGSRVLKAGEGFFVGAEVPYTYEAGPAGVEVLEFRGATSFDMKVRDQTVARWKPILEAALANQASWLAPAP